MIESYHADEWTFRWSANGGTREIAWQPAKSRWVSRFRVKPGGWTQPQVIRNLESPENTEQARRTARCYAGEHGDRKSLPAPVAV